MWVASTCWQRARGTAVEFGSGLIRPPGFGRPEVLSTAMSERHCATPGKLVAKNFTLPAESLITKLNARPSMSLVSLMQRLFWMFMQLKSVVVPLLNTGTEHVPPLGTVPSGHMAQGMFIHETAPQEFGVHCIVGNGATPPIVFVLTSA